MNSVRVQPYGKLRTKFDRIALSMQVLNTVCQALKLAFCTSARGSEFMIDNEWCADFKVGTVIPKPVFELTYLLAANCEECQEGCPR